MVSNAKRLGAAILVLGLSAVGWGATHWLSQWPSANGTIFFLCWILTGAAVAALRIRFPRMKGSLSFHFFVVLLCLPELSLPEILVIAASGSLLQSALDRDFAGFPSLWIDSAISCLAAAASYLAFQHLNVAQSAKVAPEQLPLLFVAAACAYFVTATIATAAVASVVEQKSVTTLWRDRYFWTFPYYIAVGSAAGLIVSLRAHSGGATIWLLLPVLYWMFNSYRHHVKFAQREEHQLKELGNLHFRTIEALALAIEGNDATKHAHLRRVSTYVVEVGRQMKLSESELQALHAASMLHDIGKLAVPEHIVTKPGKLTEQEFERMKVHPVAGAEILEQVRFPYPVAPIVRSHHEKWDGSGYPSGLKGEEIPIGARILAAVDCLDALVSDRYHRRALSIEQAMEHVLLESGRSFDPAVVTILAARYEELEEKVNRIQGSDLEHIAWVTIEPHTKSAEEIPVQPQHGAFLQRIAETRREEHQSFYLARELGNSLSLDDTLSVCAVRIQAMCPYDSIAIFIQREEILVAEYSSGEDARILSRSGIPWGQGLVGQVAQTCVPVINSDPRQDLDALGSQAATSLQSALVVPLEGTAGVVGVLALYAARKNGFTQDHLRIATGISAKAGLAVENALKYSKAEISATTDALTGLPNSRALFQHMDAEISRSARYRKPVTVLVGDLDRFKNVNDTFGHMAGNQLLKAVATALKNECREYDFVARMGGDEFVMVLVDTRLSPDDFVLSRLQEAVKRASIQSIGHDGVGLSLGHACFPEDGSDAEALLVAADRRMYEVKQYSAMESAPRRQRLVES
ncbi:MAG: HD domain-containing phosphohydrolase [Acidobacteriota bacterium]